MLLDPHRFSEEHRRSNPHLFAFFHASGLDARHETYRARLDTDSRTVKGGSARGINAETFLTVISRFKGERCRRSCDASVWCSIWTQSSVTESSADVGPNITGQFTITNGAGSCSGAQDASNAFSLMSLGTGATFSRSENRYEQHAISFSAERGSSLYGASFEVQPLSSRLLPCIKL